MDISAAILFYSKHSQKSLYLKHEIEQLEVTMEFVCVDKKIIREALLEDNRYDIEEIPCVLLLYRNQDYTTLKGRALDAWFYQLKENVMNLRNQQMLEYQEYIQQQIHNQINEQNIMTNGIDHKITDNPGRPLSPPGKRKIEYEESSGGDYNLIDITSYPQENNEQINPTQKKKKTAAEEKRDDIRTIQEKLLAEREKIDKLVDGEKPFI
jgi:hypothetical protein